MPRHPGENSHALGRARVAVAARAALAAAALLALAHGCGEDEGGERVGTNVRAVVYGADDRLEYFDVASAEARARIAGSAVALLPRSRLGPQAANGTIALDPSVQTWGVQYGLCPGEPFADEPAAAFCSGVLVDWDLVLTAGHCARLFALADVAVVFGYYYTAPGQLAAGEVRAPVEIVDDRHDTPGGTPDLDYAWLRLDRRVSPPRAPAPVHATPGVALGDPIVSIGAGGGVPIKLDQGGHVLDVRAGTDDYFVADTDTSRGSSGGGGFDRQLVLAGVFARGGEDFVAGADGGCATTFRHAGGADASEAFTYTGRAVEGLCAKAPGASSLCRADCGDPCQALPPPSDEGGGCSLAPGRARDGAAACALALLAAAWLACRARARNLRRALR